MTTKHRSTVVPTNYTEVFRNYYPMILGMVKKYGIRPEQREDVAMTILTKFIEKDALADYDPTYINADGKPSKFESFMSGFVFAYVRYFVSRQVIVSDREPCLIDQPTSETAEGASWADLNGFTHVDDFSYLEHAETVAAVRKHLASRPVQGKADFSLLFDLIVEQMDEHGKILTSELAELFQVSAPSVRAWMLKLRAEISTVRDSA